MFRHFVAPLSMLLLLSAAAPAVGQPFVVNGAPPDQVDVFMMIGGQKTRLGTVGADGTVQPSDPTLFAKQPKMEIFGLRCEGGRYSVVLAESLSSLMPDDRNRCDPDRAAKAGDSCDCERLGFWLPGQRNAVNLANLAAASQPGDRGFAIGAFGFGAFKQTTITNADSASGVIDARFSATNPPYNAPRQIDINETASGPAFGGGVNFAFGSVMGARLAAAWESQRTTPTQNVVGNRDAGGLIFEQQGSSEISSTALLLGPTVSLPGGIVLTGGPAISWWNVDITQTGRVRAGCPSPCMVVRTDDVSETASGTDVGFFIGGEYYPRNSWVGVSLFILQTRYQDVYDPTKGLGWPKDWTDRNVFVGVVFRTTNTLR